MKRCEITAALIRGRAFPLPFATQGGLAPSRFRSPEVELLLAFVEQLVLQARHFRTLIRVQIRAGEQRFGGKDVLASRPFLVIGHTSVTLRCTDLLLQRSEALLAPGKTQDGDLDSKLADLSCHLG